MTIAPTAGNVNLVLESFKQIHPVYYAKSVGTQLQPMAYDPILWQPDYLKSKAKRIIIKTTRQCGKSTTTAFKATHRAKIGKEFIVIFSPTEKTIQGADEEDRRYNQDGSRPGVGDRQRAGEDIQKTAAGSWPFVGQKNLPVGFLQQH